MSIANHMSVVHMYTLALPPRFPLACSSFPSLVSPPSFPPVTQHAAHGDAGGRGRSRGRGAFPQGRRGRGATLGAPPRPSPAETEPPSREFALGSRPSRSTPPPQPPPGDPAPSQPGGADAEANERRPPPVRRRACVAKVEKYRPKVIRDVVGNTEAMARLEVIAREGNVPNMLLAGAPGTGKTTSIMCLARQVLGPKVKEAVLELNASDDRGIDVVRNKIKMFAQKKCSLGPGQHKIVILDEADSMTSAAQQALRRTMEIHSSTTRFALACNLSTKIIEPIQSRCAIVRFTRLADEEVLDRLMHVCDAEEVPRLPKGLEAIVFTADGDMRQGLNNLQATFYGFGLISPDNVFKVCDQPHPLAMGKILQHCLDAKLDQANQGMMSLVEMGYSASDIIGTMFRVARNYDMAEFLKLEVLKEIGFCQMRISEGVTSPLQLSGLLAKMCKLRLRSQQGGG